MNIYLISQNSNNGYDVFDAAVVVAKTADEAKKIYPSSNYKWSNEFGCFCCAYSHQKMCDNYGQWVNDLSKITVQLIGTTETYRSGEVILASFNAG